MDYKELEVRSTLFYGLLATAPSLLLAAELYSTIKEFHSVVNELSTSASTVKVINRVPSEIWKMISRELILANFEFCSRKLIIEATCSRCIEIVEVEKYCYDCESSLPCSCVKEATTWNNFEDLCQNDDYNDCCAIRLSKHFRESLQETVAKINELLATFNLKLIDEHRTHQPINAESIMLLPIGIIEKGVTQSPCARDIYEKREPFKNSISFSRNAFDLPDTAESIDKRFKDLQLQYQVEFGEEEPGINDDIDSAAVDSNRMISQKSLHQNDIRGRWNLFNWVQPEYHFIS